MALLKSAAVSADGLPVCDIVIAVHNQLDAVDDCLRSVLAYTAVPFRILVVDDASDDYVASRLLRFADENTSVQVLRNDVNLGFIRSSNRGLAASTAPYVCLLNSDTIVTPGWLEGLLRCARSDPRIQVVNPISNAAANMSVQMAPGLDVFTMALAVAACSRRDYPDIVTAVGFCFLVTRAALQAFGAFDEIYGVAYCEESDYCMRVTGAGWRVVAADDTFVYHRGGASFGRSRERYNKNRRIFDERWSLRYEAEYAAFLARNPLNYLRLALIQGLQQELHAPTDSPLSAPGGLGVFEPLWLMSLDAWRRGGVRGLFRKVGMVPGHLRNTASRLRSRSIRDSESGFVLPDNPEEPVRLVATAEYCSRLPRKVGLRIAILVWKFEIYGGVLAITELANRLVLEGHDVMLMTLGVEPAPGLFHLYTRPMVFRSVESLAAAVTDVDVVVATFWPTATEWLPAIRRSNPTVRAVYFVQDYEAWFLAAHESEDQQRIIESYARADVRIVTSSWLGEKLARHGHTSVVVPIGIDTRVFYPRRSAASAGAVARILVQARPRNPWRGFDRARQVLSELARRGRSFEAVFFGCDDAALEQHDLPFLYHNEGIVSARDAVARLYSTCDLLFDPSRFQAFGLPGLEAMACGVPTVLPSRGGITEYARHGVNTLLVEPDDTERQVEAIERLLDDKQLRADIIEAGLATAARFTSHEMAIRHLAVYGDRGRGALLHAGDASDPGNRAMDPQHAAGRPQA